MRLRFKDATRQDDDDDDEPPHNKDPPATSKTKKKKAKRKQLRVKSRKGASGEQGEVQESETLYQAGSFNDERMKFIREVMAEEGLKFRQASERWMQSTRRQTLLQGMPLKEQIRRRFVIPQKKAKV